MVKKNILAVNLRKICTQAQNWGFEAAVLSFFFVLSVFFVMSVLFILFIFFSVCPLCHVRPLCPQLSILFVLSCSSSLSSLSILLVMPLFYLWKVLTLQEETRPNGLEKFVNWYLVLIHIFRWHTLGQIKGHSRWSKGQLFHKEISF